MELAGAYLIEGSTEKIAAVNEYLSKRGVEVHANPDIFVQTFKHYGIDEARALRARASLRATGGGTRIFVIALSTITAEAQNALLKTLEDGSEAIFFIIVPSPHALLPTVRSRVQMLALTSVAREGIVDTEAFVKATAEKRLEMLKPLFEKDDDEKRDIGAIITFLSSLERTLGKRGARTSRTGLKAVYRARAYVGDKGALVKPLLEQVALLV
jgi:DNA polymerase III delta prime subunit